MARKSRAQPVPEKPDADRALLWRIGIYIRISREDARSGGESESVTNQRKTNLAFIEENFQKGTFLLAGDYVDDGRSGTTEDARPGFQKLCEDIASGKVNCIICKTLSRAFRNYADQGKFLEQFLPAYGCRFIAVSNPFVDTLSNPECTQNMEIPINGLMNDRYAAKTSEDVRRIFRTKRMRGEFIGAFAPYGYLKNPENSSVLQIDPEAAEIVRNIYALFLDGMGISAIVRFLNDRGIPCPSLDKRERLGANYRNPNCGPKPLWSSSTVRNILKNRVYCGDMVQGRFRIKSYKIHIQEKVPEREWFVVENTHDPIVSRETFAKAQRLLEKDTRIAPGEDAPHLFSGFLRCADCGKAMVRSEVKGNVYYYCGAYKRQSKQACTKHTLRHRSLEAAVLYAIRLQLYLFSDAAEAREKAGALPAEKFRSRELPAAAARKERELEKLSGYLRAAYQDWKDGAIGPEEYASLRECYRREEAALTESIRRLRAEAESRDAGSPFPAFFDGTGTLSGLSREILAELVDRILVSEGGKIRIIFRFSDGLKGKDAGSRC